MEKFVVHEDSMQPSLHPGDRLIASRRAPRAGDIVVFPDPGDSGGWLIKRAVAVPGAAVTIRSSRLSVDHRDGTHSEWNLPFVERDAAWTLAEDEVFVLSDALEATRADSRVYGPISTTGMLTAVLRYAPIGRFKVLR